MTFGSFPKIHTHLGVRSSRRPPSPPIRLTPHFGPRYPFCSIYPQAPSVEMFNFPVVKKLPHHLDYPNLVQMTTMRRRMATMGRRMTTMLGRMTTMRRCNKTTMRMKMTTMMARMTTMRRRMATMRRRMTTMMGTACRKPAGRRDPSEEPEHGESFLD